MFTIHLHRMFRVEKCAFLYCVRTMMRKTFPEAGLKVEIYRNVCVCVCCALVRMPSGCEKIETFIFSVCALRTIK